MRVARISIVEFKSEAELETFADNVEKTFWDIYPTAESIDLVRTGPTSVINSTIFPSETAANQTLSGRQEFFDKHKDGIIDTFFHIGEVAFSKNSSGKPRETSKNIRPTSKVAETSLSKTVTNRSKEPQKYNNLTLQIDQLSSEVAELKEMISQFVAKLPS